MLLAFGKCEENVIKHAHPSLQVDKSIIVRVLRKDTNTGLWLHVK